jgi:hypothetical protein
MSWGWSVSEKMRIPRELIDKWVVEYDHGAASPASMDRLEYIAEQAAEWMRQKCEKEIPTSWLDPILTGPNCIKGPPYGGREIEALLSGLALRIRNVGHGQAK